MKAYHYLLVLFLTISFSQCFDITEEDFENITFMNPTKFKINGTNPAYFRYELGENKNIIGLEFLRANLYMVVVKTYSSYENKTKEQNYTLADNQFIEINVTDYEKYIYIVIELTHKEYFYDDYLTIYDSEKPIELEHNKVISINKFLSNNEYQMTYKSDNKFIALYYSTQNYDNNTRKITVEYGDKTYIDGGMESSYKQILNLTGDSILKVKVENLVEEDYNNEKNEEFSLIIYEIEDMEYHFNKIETNNLQKINYIYNNESQTFYFYADISELGNPNTLDFKFNFKYFNSKTSKIEVLSKAVYLDESITQNELEANIPDGKEFPSFYDDESDEYYRLYFNNINSEKIFKYILVSVEISDENYYYGNNILEFSMGEKIEKKNFSDIQYNEKETIEKDIKSYIPQYYQIKLNPNEIYLLTSANKNEFISKIIKGKLINDDNTMNTNYISNDNEIIVLKDIEEITLKLFGTKTKVKFYIEKINASIFDYYENERNNNKIYEFKMKKDEIRYVLGTYSYDNYYCGSLKVNYYADVESGEFELYYKNNISYEDKSSIFPSNENYIKNFDEIFSLDTNIDLFRVKCKADGTLKIRPEYKEFNVTTHLIQKDTINTITMSELSEVVQLSAPIVKTNKMLFFSIKIVKEEQLLTLVNDNQITLKIWPDTEGLFPIGNIKFGETFKGSINLENYKADELAIHVDSNDYSTEIQVIEIIQNEFNTYQEIKEGDNINLTSYNIFYKISENCKDVSINIENLEDKNISYGIIKSSINDSNYLITADKYKDTVSKDIKKDKENIIFNNPYYHAKNNLEPYMYFILSIVGEENDMKYNIKLSLTKDKSSDDTPEDDDTTKIIIIVVIIVAVILILLAIILFTFLSKKRRSSSDIEKISSIDPKETPIL